MKNEIISWPRGRFYDYGNRPSIERPFGSRVCVLVRLAMWHVLDVDICSPFRGETRAMIQHEHSFAGEEGNYRCACGVTRPDRDDKLPVHRMSTRNLLHLLRNPYGHTPEEISNVRHAAADRLEELEKQLKHAHDAYVNMRDWAEANGVDTKAYVGPH